MSTMLPDEIEPINLNLIRKANAFIKQGNKASKPTENFVQRGKYDIDIDDGLAEALMLFSESAHIASSSIFITAFNIILQRYTGQNFTLLGQAVIKSEETEDVDIGCFWSEFNSRQTFLNQLRDIDTQVSGISDYTRLCSAQLPQGLAKLPIGEEFFQFFFVCEKENSVIRSANGAPEIELVNELINRFNRFYFGLHIKETIDNTSISLFFNQEQFGIGFIQRFGNHLINLLKTAIKDPDLSIGSYNILGNTEATVLLKDFNRTVTAYPKEKTLFSLFEEQVLKGPNNIALTKADKQLTYYEVNQRANRLAHQLIAEGIKPGDNVGLLVNRGFNMIIGMLGILKSGGAYVPIDPDYPIDRQEYIYNQSHLKIIVADANYKLKSVIGKKIFKLIDADVSNSFADANPNLSIDSTQLAYTIYTSGSTGRPKGVMIEHHSAVNLILWVNKIFNVGPTDKLLFITSMCFDLSVYDIFGMLAAGGTLVIAEKDEIQDVKKLYSMLVEYKITFWDSVPTTMNYLMRTLEMEEPAYRYDGLKTVFMSGDWIPVELPDKIKKFYPETAVISLGGATEGTVWSNFFVVEQVDKNWTSIPYGKPIANNFFYVLNDHLQPVPVGTIGELYIGGVGVARGYASDAEKTAASFIADPFNGGKMYKTGDLGRMMPDFNMEFIGRKDNQVKIQGFRVELGEIENVLSTSGLIRSALVLAKNDLQGVKRLVAYIVHKEVKVTKEVLALYLKEILPDYMIPAIWVEMERFPLTGNGKIDRNALPDVNEVPAADKKLVAAETETENTLLEIWKEYFKRNELDVTSNFFEIGGHSLMAVQILSKLKKITQKSFQISALYEYPTIRMLSMFIDSERRNYNYKSLVPIKQSGSKAPLYIIHGDGLNVLNFSELPKYVDPEQPLYGLQALGLNGVDEPIDSLPVIAYLYMQEIIEHNPSGPYLLAGYSSGGYVAMEIRKQMLTLGKKVEMLIIFDTDAEKTEYKDWYSLLPKKAKRHFPRLIQAFKMSVNQFFGGKSPYQVPPLIQKQDTKEFYKLMNKIKAKHVTAFRNYPLEPFNGKLYLYKAKISVHYVEYGNLLGWEKYAQKGVELFEVPGDHFSMLLPPHVAYLGATLQKNINDVMKGKI